MPGFVSRQPCYIKLVKEQDTMARDRRASDSTSQLAL